MKKRRSFLFFLQLSFLLLFLHIPTWSNAQTYDTINRVYADYIASFKDSAFGLQLITSNKYCRFQLQYHPNPGTDHIMKFRPNESTLLGFGIDYKWLGLRFAFGMPWIRNDDKKYGKTTQIALQAHIYSRKFISDLYLQSYKGFYIDNPEQFNSNAWQWNSEMPYPSRRDINTQSAGINFNYVFNNERLSLRSSFNQTEWQKKSAGSVLTGANFSYFHLSADSSIVAIPTNNMFNDSAKITNVHISQLGWTIGYAYTLVIKRHIFITLSLNPGIALQVSNTEAKNHKMEEQMLKIAFFGNARFSFGYNGEDYFYGIMTVVDSYNLNSSSSLKMQFSNGLFRLFFGRRFGLKKYQ